MNDVAAVPTMRKYELFLCLDPTLTEKELKNELKKIKDLITQSGEVFHEQMWGKRDLYYKIKKQEKGIYALMSFTFVPAKIAEFKRELGLTLSVYRYNLQNLPENYTVPVREEKVAETEEVVAEKPVKKVIKKDPVAIPSEKKIEPVVVVEEVVSEPTVVHESLVIETVTDDEAEKPAVSARGKMKNFDEGLDKIISDLS